MFFLYIETIYIYLNFEFVVYRQLWELTLKIEAKMYKIDNNFFMSKFRKKCGGKFCI